ncbi:HlyIII-domain-containing protein [Mycena sp. CBHHK59/15]|nr:HlyIII-domain-containing protein [Mycena sp. CBHHK59/15]
MATPPSNLQKYSDLPAWRQDNPAILTGYRKETDSWSGIIDGLWVWHNETINIWSHLLGALSIVGFFWLCNVGTSWEWIASNPLLSSARTVTWCDRGGMGIFLLGALMCFGCSTAFHASTCHSQSVVRYMNRVDYLGILVLGTVNFFPSFHYAFFCDPHLRNLYIFSMTLSGLVGIYLVCAPTYASPAYRRMRTYTFFTLGVVALAPFVHCFVRYGIDQAAKSLSTRWIVIEIVAYVGGALLYSERCPECLAPGKFDIIGASHQIFHVCSLVAVLTHYLAISDGFRYWHFERNGSCI